MRRIFVFCSKLCSLLLLAAIQLPHSSRTAEDLLSRSPEHWTQEPLVRIVREDGVGSTITGAPTHTPAPSPSSTRECRAEVQDGFHWPVTPVGRTASGRCFSNTSDATRMCHEGGEWGMVKCMLDDELMDLKNQLSNGMPLLAVVREFRNITGDMTRLPRPLSDSYFLRKTLTAAEEDSVALQEFIQDFFGSASNLVHPDYRLGSTANISKTDRIAAGSTLVHTMDSFALRTVARSNQSRINDSNIHMEVQTVQPSRMTAGLTAIEDEGTSLFLPNEVFQQLTSYETVPLASFVYSNMSYYFPDSRPDYEDRDILLASPIVSSALQCGDSQCNVNLNHSTIQLTFTHPRELNDQLRFNRSLTTTCVFWEFLEYADNNDIETGQWGTVGCTRNEQMSSPLTTICECSHLTHFAILLSSDAAEISDEHATVLGIIGYVGVSISLLAMAVTAATFIIIRSLWSMRNYIHVNLCVSLFVAQLIFVIGVDKTAHRNACSAVAVLLHYFFLVTFMWMLMEGVVLYVALVRVFIKHKKRYIIAFTLASYGLPLLYLCLTVPLGFLLESERGYGHEEACWLNYDTNFVWSFIAPVILIILINIGFLVIVLVITCGHYQREIHHSKMEGVRHWLKVFASLLVVMGITWIIGVLVFDESLLSVAYIFTTLVALQGVFIFILFVPLSKQVREAYRRWWRDVVSTWTRRSTRKSDPRNRNHTPVLPSSSDRVTPSLTENGSSLSPLTQSGNSNMSMRTMVQRAREGHEELVECEEEITVL